MFFSCYNDDDVLKLLAALQVVSGAPRSADADRADGDVGARAHRRRPAERTRHAARGRGPTRLLAKQHRGWRVRALHAHCNRSL